MEGPSRLVFGRCRIDVPSRVLVRNGDPVEVQPRAFDLLLYLIEHRDRVVPVQELLDALWHGVSVTPSSLSRAVYKARIALGDDGRSQRSIATVRGRGFQFVAPLRWDEGAPAEEAGSDFVGREPELGCLEEALSAARSGRGGLVLLTGEPGIGKTRTAHEFATRAGGVDARVVRCPEGAGTPAYWPWRRLGRVLAAGRTRSELERLAGREAADLAQLDPELARELAAKDLPEFSPHEMRLRLFEGATAVLGRIARERPLLVVLDDLQLADLPSLQFLRYLAHALPDLPMLVVGTARDTDLADDAERRRLLADAERSAGGRTLELSALSRAEVGRLGEKRLRRSLPAETLEELHARSGGNPFFLGELLALMERDARDLEPRLPPTVREAVEAHLGSLGKEARRLLGVAAVFGTEFSPGLLARASGAATEAVMRCIEAAERAHVLEPADEPSGARRFAHMLLREALYQELDVGERARVHLRVAQALESAPTIEPSEVAYHSYRGASVGGAETALHWARRAADHCQSQLAFEQAALHLEHALEMLAFLPEDAALRCDLLFEAGRAHTLAGAVIRGEEHLLEAARSARDLADQGRGSALRRVANFASVLWYATASGELRRILVEALGNVAREGRVADDAGEELALALGPGLLRGEPEISSLACRGLRLARASGQPRVLARALCAWHWIEWRPENWPERWAAVREVEKLGEAAGPEALLEARYLRALDALEQGRRDELLAALAALEAPARKTGHGLGMWRACMLRSVIATMEGRFARGEALLREALAVGQRHPSPRFEPIAPYFAQQSCSRALQGTVEWAPQTKGAATEPSEDVGEAGEAPDANVAWVVFRAARLVETGDLAAARRQLERVAHHDLMSASHPIWMHVMLAPVWSALRDREACQTVHEIFAPHRGQAILQIDYGTFQSVAGRYLGLLSWGMGELSRAQEEFEDALALLDGLQATAFSIEVRTEYARMLTERAGPGDRTAALAHLGTAHADATRLRIPAIVRRIEGARSRIEA